MAVLPNTWLCFDVSKVSQEFWFADATLSPLPVCCFIYFFIYILCLPLPLSCQFIGLWARGEAAGYAHSLPWCHFLKPIIQGGRVPQGLLTWGLSNPMLRKNIKWGHWGSEKGHNVLEKMQLNNRQNSKNQLSFN